MYTCIKSNNNYNNNKIYFHEQAFKQRKREIKVAVQLANRLQKFIDNNCNEIAFKEMIEIEAKELSSSPFGGTLVKTIGECYLEFARRELGQEDSHKH
jgi:hypothetical protein